jgi:NAD(P)-dependent dehydrogenase (short-subunit alcohol dehydrogenase family)
LIELELGCWIAVESFPGVAQAADVALGGISPGLGARCSARVRGRLVIIGSIGEKITMPFAGPLSASKCAIAALADAFRQELAPWGIAVTLIEPASIHTAAVEKLRRDAERAVEAFPPDGKELYQDIYQQMMDTAVAREQRGSPPGVVADVIGHVLSARRPRARYLVGKDAWLLAALALAGTHSGAGCAAPPPVPPARTRLPRHMGLTEEAVRTPVADRKRAGPCERDCRDGGSS